MSERYVVKESLIHEKGVFAARFLRAGEFIGRYIARKVKRDSRYVLWVADEGEKPQGYLGIGRLRFLNHNPRPNAALHGALDFYAIRNIKAGEEITFHYGEDWHEGLPGERPAHQGSNVSDAEIALIERIKHLNGSKNGSNRRARLR